MIHQLQDCCTRVKNWMDHKRLKMNSDKTDFILNQMCFLNNRTNFVQKDKLLTGYSWLHQVLKKMFSKASLNKHKVYQKMFI